MGNRARIRSAARARMKQHHKDVVEAHRRLVAEGVEEVITERAANPEVLAQVAADLPAQRDRLARAGWLLTRPAGDGAGCWDHPRRALRVIHSVSLEADGGMWAHVSVSHPDNRLPGWAEVRDAQWLLYPDRPGVVVVAAQTSHVNISEVAHVWTCLTRDSVPDFSWHGSI